MEERKPYGVKKEMKKYLNTVEELTQALSEGKTVYATDEFCNGESKLKLINNILERKDADGEIIIGGTVIFKGNVFYIKEKEPLKIEVGKFYKTRSDVKVICVKKTSERGYSCCFAVLGQERIISTTAKGEFVEGEERAGDIVDYWEDK